MHSTLVGIKLNYIYIYIYVYAFNVMKAFGYPTSIGRWGFQDQGGCTTLPCLAGRCVLIYNYIYIYI